MTNKINLGYGSVGFKEDIGFDISTKAVPLKSTNGLSIKKVTCKSKQMSNLVCVHKFLDEVLFEPCYVVPNEVGSSPDEKIHTATFVVNHKFFLHVVVDEDWSLYPSLMAGENEDIRAIKFEYEGKQLEAFFEEVKKDIKNLISK